MSAETAKLTNARWVQTTLLTKPPEGGYPIPKVSDFKLVKEPLTTIDQMEDNEVLVKSHFLSPDPYIVSYIMAREENVGKTVWAGAAGEIILSKTDTFAVGDKVVGGGSAGSQQYFKCEAKNLRKLPEGAKLSTALGVCGMPGVTAYFATHDILGADLSGKTIIVTGAAGAVGSAAGQIARLLGAAKVIGLAGSDEKCKHSVKKFGYDHMLNYKSENLEKSLAELAPFHGFFDNTGGPAAKLIKALLVDGANVAKVGNIGGDSTSEKHDARLNIKGFYAGSKVSEWPAAIQILSKWVDEDKLKYDETVLKGIESIPEAFIRQRTGKQLGKMIVDLE